MRDMRVAGDDDDKWAPIVPVNHPELRTSAKAMDMEAIAEMKTPMDWKELRKTPLHVFPVEAIMADPLATKIHGCGCKASKIIRVKDDMDETKTLQVVYVLDV